MGLPEVRQVTPEEGRAIFDRAAWRLMQITGDEFLQRWDAGEYAGPEEGPERTVPRDADPVRSSGGVMKVLK